MLERSMLLRGAGMFFSLVLVVGAIVAVAAMIAAATTALVWVPPLLAKVTHDLLSGLGAWSNFWLLWIGYLVAMLAIESATTRRATPKTNPSDTID